MTFHSRGYACVQCAHFPVKEARAIELVRTLPDGEVVEVTGPFCDNACADAWKESRT